MAGEDGSGTRGALRTGSSAAPNQYNDRLLQSTTSCGAEISAQRLDALELHGSAFGNVKGIFAAA
jgi:hypothetical protein